MFYTIYFKYIFSHLKIYKLFLSKEIMKREKVLIIKTGYSEFLEEHNDSRNVSLGDVLRTTILLNLFKEDNITWVTDSTAFPLLKNNPYINRLLPFDLPTVLQLQQERFDTLINLEKISGICALADKINAWKKYGFRFDSETGKADAYDNALEILSVSANPYLKQQNKRLIQELLFEMIGKKWEGEEYIFVPSLNAEKKFDVCLNTLVGKKWPMKVWSKENWDALEEMLVRAGFCVTRQDKQKDILNDLESYINWINSAKTIISTDSLGLHLGIALKKNVLGLFGPTSSDEVYFYGRGKAILPEPAPSCMPCFRTDECEKGSCVNTISPERVYKTFIQSLSILPQ